MKTKLYLIAGIIGLIIIIGYMFNQIEKLKAEKETQLSNVSQLLLEKAKHTSLILSYKQAQGIATLKIDSLSNALKIKPKTIERTIEKIVTVHDTTVKEVPVYILGNDRWLISDQDKCWSWKGIAILNNDSLKISRTSFDYTNKTTDIYFWERTKKFWIIRYGKKKTYVKTSSDCGESFTREIDIRK